MEFEHSVKGSKWKKHKYLEIRNGKYIYPNDKTGYRGSKQASRFRWDNRYEQEAQKYKAKVYKNGVKMYTRDDGTTVVTYPGHGIWTVPKGTDLKSLGERLDNMDKTYNMSGMESSNPEQAKYINKFINKLNDNINGVKSWDMPNSGNANQQQAVTNKTAKTNNAAKQQTNEQPQEQQPAPQPQEQPQPQPQEQQPAPQPQQAAAPAQQTSEIETVNAQAQEQPKQQVSEAEANSSKSRLTRIGNRRNKLFTEAQELSKKLAQNPKDEDIQEEINDLYNEIDNYNDEIVDHIEKLQAFGMPNADIQKYANSVGIAIDSNMKPYYLNIKNLEKRNSAQTIAHNLSKSLYDQYFGNDDTDSFEHVGRSKRDGAKVGSGRYPLGSGENPRSENNRFIKRGAKALNRYEKERDNRNEKESFREKNGSGYKLYEPKNVYDNKSKKREWENVKRSVDNAKKYEQEEEQLQKDYKQKSKQIQKDMNKLSDRDFDGYNRDARSLEDYRRLQKQQTDLNDLYKQQLSMMQQMQNMQNSYHQQQMQSMQNEYRRQQESNARKSDTVEISKSDWDTMMRHINESNNEINRLNYQNNKNELDNKNLKKGKAIRNIAIAGATIYIISKAVKGNKEKVNLASAIGDLKEATNNLNTFKETANNVKEASKAASKEPSKNKQEQKQQKKETQAKTKEAMNSLEKSGSILLKGARQGFENGLFDGGKDAAKAITKGAVMYTSKMALDAIAGEKVSSAMYKSNDWSNIGKFFENNTNKNNKYDKFESSKSNNINAVGGYMRPEDFTNWANVKKNVRR